jgi:hypothetical protein
MCLLDMLAGRATAIHLEPPGTAGVGFEFALDRPATKEWHQVKYQNSKLGKWSMYELEAKKVLTNFKEKLSASTSDSCMFVSAHAAFPLGRLCSLAGLATSIENFKDDLLPSEQVED